MSSPEPSETPAPANALAPSGSAALQSPSQRAASSPPSDAAIKPLASSEMYGLAGAAGGVTGTTGSAADAFGSRAGSRSGVSVTIGLSSTSSVRRCSPAISIRRSNGRRPGLTIRTTREPAEMPSGSASGVVPRSRLST